MEEKKRDVPSERENRGKMSSLQTPRAGQGRKAKAVALTRVGGTPQRQTGFGQQQGRSHLSPESAAWGLSLPSSDNIL